MKESVTYQAIMDEGRQDEARRLLLRLGSARFGGAPAAEQLRTLEAITEVSRLEDLVVRVSQVGNWGELLAIVAPPPPSPPTPRRRKKS
jgi:hypothetical protein